MDMGYDYDADGNITRIKGVIQEPKGSPSGGSATPKPLIPSIPIAQGGRTSATRTCSYDAFGQLVEATGLVQLALVASDAYTLKGTQHLSLDNGDDLERYTRTYRYDLAGNLNRVQHRGVTHAWTQSFTVESASNRRWPTPEDNAAAAGPLFDATSNLTAMPHLRALEWYQQGRLARAVIGRPGRLAQRRGALRLRWRSPVRTIVRSLLDHVTGWVERIDTLYLDGCERRPINHAGVPILERVTSHISFGDRNIALVHRWQLDTLGRETETLNTAKIHYQLGDHCACGFQRGSSEIKEM